MVGMIIQIAIQAGVLSLLMFLLARWESDFSFSKVFAVASAISLGLLVLDIALLSQIGLFVVFVDMGFIALMLVKFCWLPVRKAVLVTLIYCVFLVGQFFATVYINNKIMGSTAGAMSDLDEQSEYMQEIQQAMIEDAQGGAPVSAAQQAEVERMARESEEQARTFEAEVEAERARQRRAQAVGRRSTVTRGVAAPVVPAPVENVENWDAAFAAVKVTGIIGSEGQQMAIVNGCRIKNGGIVALVHGDKIYRLKVKIIGGKRVRLTPAGTSPAP